MKYHLLIVKLGHFSTVSRASCCAEVKSGSEICEFLARDLDTTAEYSKNFLYIDDRTIICTSGNHIYVNVRDYLCSGNKKFYLKSEIFLMCKSIKPKNLCC